MSSYEEEHRRNKDKDKDSIVCLTVVLFGLGDNSPHYPLAKYFFGSVKIRKLLFYLFKS